MLNFDWAANVGAAMAASRLKGWQVRIALTFGEAVEEHSADTLAHSVRVTRHAVRLGYRLGLGAEAVRELRLAALLHDLGKGHVPLSLLEKPGRFTPEEHLAMQGHARVGFEVARALQLPDAVAAAIRHHHERWDGTGYPDRLAGPEISVAARILTVADIFDALTSDRPYRRALGETTALEIMQAESGCTVDPTLFRIHARLVTETESTQAPALRLASQRSRLAVAAA